MKVLVLTKYARSGASSRLRFYQYIDYFKNNEYASDFIISSLFDHQYIESIYSQKRVSRFSIIKAGIKRFLLLIKKRNKFDLIWIEKEIFPYFPAWLELLLFWNKKIVLDYDDATFHNYDAHKNFLVRLFFSKKIDRLMKSANLIIVGNKYLKQRAVMAGAKKIEILPTVVDLNLYTRSGIDLIDNLIPLIGWIGTPPTQKLLKIIESSLSDLYRIKKFKFIAIGADLNLKLGNFDYEILPWSEKTEVELLSKIDIGVMPLEDQSFQRGKCGYKLIQYMALAKPVIASPVGANVEIVQHKKNGLLASSPGEWLDALLFFLNDPKKMKSMGVNSRKIVEENFSLQKYAPILFKFLEKECDVAI